MASGRARRAPGPSPFWPTRTPCMADTSTGALSAVILAAGQGTRLKSARPKGLHPLGGRPLVSYSVEAAAAVTGRAPALVVGHGSAAVRAALGNQVTYVEQA